MAKSSQSDPAKHAPTRGDEAAKGTARAASRGRKTQVRRSGIHGKGVYALRDFAPGELIIEYVGERISWKEAERRHARQQGDPFHTFFFQTEKGDVIDGGGIGGNSARWINHSCEPNCEAEEDDDGRVFVVALLPIAAGDELFYDYALEIDARITAALKRDYQCLCGAPTCRGTMLKTRRKAAVKAAPKKAAKKAAKKVSAEKANDKAQPAKRSSSSGTSARSPAAADTPHLAAGSETPAPIPKRRGRKGAKP